MPVEHFSPEKLTTEEAIDAAGQTALAETYENSEGDNESSALIQAHINRHAKEWGRKTREHLADAYPHRDSEAMLADWRQHVESPHEHVSLMTFVRAVEAFIRFCGQAKRYANEDYWRGVITHHRNEILDQSQTELPLDAELLVNEWQKQMDEVRTEWEMSEIIRLQEKLLKDLDRLIEALEQLEEHAHDIDLDPGIFLDLSTAPLKPQEIEQLSRWVKYLAENEGVRNLCEMLGKMRDTEIITEELALTTVTKPQEVIDVSPDPNEEIIGIRLGRNIEYALPSELSLLSDPDISLLFDMKYFESRIMSFDMQGIAPVLTPLKVTEKAPEPEKDQRGPMIICIDTSGSMAGMPETVAKAVTLFMAYKAKAQHRPCYLVNFATEIETLDLSDKNNERDLLRFLSMSFHSGTDVAPAIVHSVELMTVKDFKKADLLIISDFIIGNVPLKVLGKMAIQRDVDNRFYSLVVGSKFLYNRHKTLFDREWAFDPMSSEVYEVTSDIVTPTREDRT